MRRSRNRLSAFLALLLAAMLTVASAGTAEDGSPDEEAQAGTARTDELDGTVPDKIPGPSGEHDMSEYYDSATGFRMQYPSVFQFDEYQTGSIAVTTDGKASLSIDNLENTGGLTEKMLLEAIRLENPDAEPRKNEQNGCLRVDRTENKGKKCRTDLYFLTGKSFHHITIKYPAGEQELYASYIEYMINSLETSETDQG